MPDYSCNFYGLGDVADITSPDGVVRIRMTSFEKATADENVPYISFVSQYRDKNGEWKDQYKKSKGQRTEIRDQFSVRIDMALEFMKMISLFTSQNKPAVLNDNGAVYQLTFSQMLQRLKMIHHERGNSRPSNQNRQYDAPPPPPSRQGGNSGYQQGNVNGYDSAPQPPRQGQQRQGQQQGGYDPHGGRSQSAPPPAPPPNRSNDQEESGYEPDPF